MGRFAVGLLWLGLVAGSVSALRCNVGQVSVDADGLISGVSIREETCEGVCTKTSTSLFRPNTLYALGCDESFRSHRRSIEAEACADDLCNTVEGLHLHREEPKAPVAVSYTCFVGLKHGAYLVGGTQVCDGACGTIKTVANNVESEAFFCASTAICKSFLQEYADPLNNCTVLDGAVTGCCCNTENNCNSKMNDITNPPPLPTDNRVPIACYSGIHFETVLLSGGEYIGCQGNCASLTYTLYSNYSLSVYTCDPATVCRGFGINNNCLDVDNGAYHACCCDTDACIDPTRNISPDNTTSSIIQCYVGAHIKNLATNNITDVGAPNYCDGLCASSLTYINGYEVEAFYCAQRGVCQYLDTVNRCENRTIGDSQTLYTCCCDDSDMCNTKNKDIPSMAPATIEPTQLIACYQGLAINGVAVQKSAFAACDGDCASLTVPTTFAGVNHSVSLFTCDPASICRQLGLRNACGSILAGGVSGCCCDSDVCINPVVNKYPTGISTLSCFVGVTIGTSYTIGGALACDGVCASFESAVNGTHVGGFFCAPRTSCEALLGSANDCATLMTTPYARACCCTAPDNCNALRDHINVTAVVPPASPPIACYSGFSLNDKHFRDANNYVACKGDCGLLTFSTTSMGQQYNATIYTCDPVNVCQAFNLKDTCSIVRNGGGGFIWGCCCSTNDCIDIAQNGIKPTIDNLQCFVGYSLANANTNYTVGDSIPCEGECGTVQTTFNGYQTYGFFCASTKLCNGLNITNTCSNYTQGGDTVTGCCCNDEHRCNLINANVIAPKTVPTVNPRGYPVACFSGLVFKGILLTPLDNYMACNGDCAFVSYSTAVGGTNVTTGIFSCDPISVCSYLGLDNSCASVANQNQPTAIAGCCCNSDDCLDIPTGLIKQRNGTRPDNLQCLVGFSVGSGANATLVGGIMPCTGSCASVHTSSNNVDLYGYFCAPNALCAALGATESCATLLLDNAATGCCCSTASNCNNKMGLPLPTYSPSTKAPIACYAGIGVNGKLVSNNSTYMSCPGDCGLITFSTTAGGNQYNATLYSCDPVGLCTSMGLANSCNSSGLVSACCCAWNDCIDYSKNTVKPSRDSLQCFVGLSAQGAAVNSTYGSVMPCNGQCGSVETTFNSHDAVAFFCASNKLCDGLGLTGSCGAIPYGSGPNFIKGCCCNNANACNLNNALVPTPVYANITTSAPIACYNGLAVNGKLLSSNDSYGACLGQCSSVTFTSTFLNYSIPTTVFSCDPSSICDHFGMSGNCGLLMSNDAWIKGCCCGFDDCISLPDGAIKAKRSGAQNCYVGFALEGPANNSTHGQSLPCTGQCASVESRINGHTTWGFFCAPNSACDALNFTNHCDTLFNAAGEYINACCCSDMDNCNINNAKVQPAPTKAPTPNRRTPIACYAGIGIGGTLLTSKSSYTACNGDCAAISYSSVFGNSTIKVTMFSCDPVSLCQEYNMDGHCNTIQADPNSPTTISGCCCSFDDCLDTAGLIKPLPVYAKSCFVGVSAMGPGANSTYGQNLPCDGECGTMMTVLSGHTTYAFFCSPAAVCAALDISNSCKKIFTQNEEIDGCCCNDVDDCNLANANVPAPPVIPAANTTAPPISCYVGIRVNGKPLSSNPNAYTSCFGECASVTYYTSYLNTSIAASLFSCDPVDLCNHYGINGDCATILSTQGHVQGCCCSTNDCLDKQSGKIKPLPRDSQQCFVGIAAETNTNGSTYGLSQQCSGQCGSLQSTINGVDSFGFFCASDKLCNSFNMTNHCAVIFTDNNDHIKACCCSDADNCNFNNAHINPPTQTIAPPVPSGTPLVCYNGLAVNGYVLTGADSYSTCFGDCGSMTYASVLNGKAYSATIFACDPASLCDHYGMKNSCSQIQQGNSSTALNSCCCNWSDCIDTNGNIKPQAPSPAPTSAAAGLSVPLLLLAVVCKCLL